MAVARIFTRNPEAATSLSEELRRQGYAVEVVVQDQPPARKDRDVEIDFEFLRHADSPTYSDELITEFAPDAAALAEASKPPTLPPTPPQMIDVPIEVTEVHADDTMPSPVVMPAMPPVSILDEPEHVAILDEPEHVYLQEVEQIEAGQIEAGQIWFEKVKAGQIDAGEIWFEEVKPDQIEAEQFDVENIEAEGMKAQSPLPSDHTGYAAQLKLAALALLAAIHNLAHQVAQACREQINLRAEQIRSARHQRQLAFQARQVRTQERATELQAARDAAAERLQQLLRERGDEISNTAPAQSQAPELEEIGLEEIESEAALIGAPDEPAVKRAPVVRAPIATYQPPVWRKMLRKPEYVFAGVAAMGSIVVVGLALMSFRPEPKLDARLDTSSAAATLQSNTTPVNSNTAKPARPSPAVRRRTAREPIVTVNKITTRHLGQDVTIRHYPQANLTSGFTQAKPAAHNRAQPELRHISDLEN